MFNSHGKGGFKGGKSGGKFGGKGFGKKSFGGRDGGKPAMHSAVCDKCKSECEVPFKPSDDRPVYCSNCFKKPEGDDRGKFGKKDFGRGSNRGSTFGGSGNADQFKKQLDSLNTKLDRIIKLLDPAASLDESLEMDEDEDDEEADFDEKE